MVEEVLVFEGGLIFEELEDLEVALELVAQLMLQHLHLQVLKPHALRELCVDALAQYRVEELEEEAAELVLILLDLLGLEVVLGFLDLLEVVLGVIPHEEVLPLEGHLVQLLQVRLQLVL